MSRVDPKAQAIFFVIAFVIGISALNYLGSSLSPTADLFLSIEGIDTDLGPTTIDQKGQLAEAAWWPNPTRIRVDPDRKGKEIFTTQIGSITLEEPLNRDVCKKPDIIVTFTNPKPIIKGDPIPHTTPEGEQFVLYKTVFEVVLKTDADLYAKNAAIGEISYTVKEQIGTTGIIVNPPFGDVWEGDVYLEYELRNHPRGFIYEVYINKDPRVGAINDEGIYTNLDLEAPAIKPIAHANQESQSAISFYDAIEGNAITDFNAVRTPRGILPVGGKLGVGADPIIEKHTWPVRDRFTGWNIYNTAIKYQVVVLVALPIEDTEDAEGKDLDPEDILEGSKHEDEIGDPRYFDPDVADAESGLDKLFEKLPSLENLNETLQLVLIALIVVAVIVIIFQVFMLFAPRRA